MNVGTVVSCHACLYFANTYMCLQVKPKEEIKKIQLDVAVLK